MASTVKVQRSAPVALTVVSVSWVPGTKRSGVAASRPASWMKTLRRSWAPGPMAASGRVGAEGDAAALVVEMGGAFAAVAVAKTLGLQALRRHQAGAALGA